VFEVGEEAIDRVSRRRSIEATAEPDDRVLEFSRDWTDAVDVLVVAVQERSEECWWVMISCSPPASGGEHIEFFEKVELKMLEQRERLGRHYIEELVDRSLLLQDAGARRHSSNILRSCV